MKLRAPVSRAVLQAASSVGGGMVLQVVDGLDVGLLEIDVLLQEDEILLRGLVIILDFLADVGAGFGD
jgi:hypothetical protein